MAGDASRQNGALGGRPQGRKNEKTLEREAQLDRLRQRVFEAFDPLISAQISSARGVSYLYKLDVNDDGTRSKPILVTDPAEIRAYLAEDYSALETTYYYITTEKPDIPALKDLWDRSLGKPAQMLELPPDAELGHVVGFTFIRNENSSPGDTADA
jgi:hypothetical protein